MGRSIPIIVTAVFLSWSTAFGQQPKSVVKLTNGVRLKGDIIEYVQDDYMIMHILDGQNLRIPFDYIYKFNVRQTFKIPGLRVRGYDLPSKGYFNYTSAGLLFLKAYSYETVKIKPAIHMINGYRFNKRLGTGIGIGLDNYGPTSAFPMYLSIRGNLFSRRITPMFNADLGYSWMWKNDSFDNYLGDFDRVEGGYYWEVGAGIRLNLRSTALILNYAYKHQNSTLTETSTSWWTVNEVRVEDRKFRNMVLSIGIEF